MKVSLFTTSLYLVTTAFPVFGQSGSSDEQMMKIRQTMSKEFAESFAKKDVAAMADHYTSDVIYTSLCPESAPTVGREALAKRFEGASKAGMRDYSSKVKEIHLISENVAWSTGMSMFTVNDKDGNPQQVKGNFIDMLRREGNAWRVSFQAFARTPCAP